MDEKHIRTVYITFYPESEVHISISRRFRAGKYRMKHYFRQLDDPSVDRVADVANYKTFHEEGRTQPYKDGWSFYEDRP